MRAPKVQDKRPGLFVRLLRVVWVVSLTGFGLVGGVYWIGKMHCPSPCQIDDRQAQSQQPATSQALSGRPKALR